MNVKRLFVAIEMVPDEAISDVFDTLKTALRFEQINWTGLNKIHITLKFFGDTQISLIDAINTALQNAVKNIAPFDLVIANAGVFDNFRNPKVIWLGIKPNDTLTRLFDNINRQLQPLGFEPESRAFKPHLTVGRIKFIKNTEILQDCLQQFKNYRITSQLINHCILFESELRREGAVYKKLQTFSFG